MHGPGLLLRGGKGESSKHTRTERQTGCKYDGQRGVGPFKGNYPGPEQRPEQTGNLRREYKINAQNVGEHDTFKAPGGPRETAGGRRKKEGKTRKTHCWLSET